MRLIITGAGSGIGRAVALRAARTEGAGARLVLVDLHDDRLASVADEVDKLGAECHVVSADLRLVTAASEVVEFALQRLGGLDAVVSNAGLVAPAPLLEMTVDSFETNMSLNARATWLLGQAAHAALKESRGAIVATAASSGSHPTPPLGAYSASKAALIMLVKQMALEWGPDGIRCNTVSPGPTLTGLTAGAFNGDGPAQRENRERREQIIPLRKVGHADEVAAAIWFLAGPDASQITGIDVTVDGGTSLVLMPASGGGSGPVGQPIG